MPEHSEHSEHSERCESDSEYNNEDECKGESAEIGLPFERDEYWGDYKSVFDDMNLEGEGEGEGDDEEHVHDDYWVRDNGNTEDVCRVIRNIKAHVTEEHKDRARLWLRQGRNQHNQNMVASGLLLQALLNEMRWYNDSTLYGFVRHWMEPMHDNTRMFPRLEIIVLRILGEAYKDLLDMEHMRLQKRVDGIVDCVANNVQAYRATQEDAVVHQALKLFRALCPYDMVLTKEQALARGDTLFDMAVRALDDTR